jgi:pSer/pThr/pTyr-binding forkhead associated (FHA) protein
VLTPWGMANNDETRVGGAPQDGGRAATPRAALLVVHSADKDAQGKRYALGEDDVTLGRDPESTVVVGSDQASRRHARIFASGGAHVLVDLDSTNGTFLNSKLVKEQTLRHGDVIRIASTVLKYVVES